MTINDWLFSVLGLFSAKFYLLRYQVLFQRGHWSTKGNILLLFIPIFLLVISSFDGSLGRVCNFWTFEALFCDLLLFMRSKCEVFDGFLPIFVWNSLWNWTGSGSLGVSNFFILARLVRRKSIFGESLGRSHYFLLLSFICFTVSSSFSKSFYFLSFNYRLSKTSR